MSHSVEAVMEELSCEPKHLEPWLALARGRVPEDGLTDHLASSIAAAVMLRRTWSTAGADLDRFFVKLAFYAPPKGDWIVVRRQRRQPQIIDRSEVDTFRAPTTGYAAFFDPKAFLQALRRRRGNGRVSEPFVVELDDEVGARRSHDKPNLYVGQTVGSLEKRIEQLVNGTAGPEWIRGHVLRGRLDLIHASFSGSKADLIRTLSADGYTVNRDTTV